MQEIFKDIRDYKGLYQISNLGRVKSFKRYPKGKILEPWKISGGYLIVALHKNKKPKPILIHTLMFETFYNVKIKKNEVIHHLNGTKDNFLQNFKCMTRKEHTKIHNKGENHPNYGKTTSEKSKKLMSEQMKGEQNPVSKFKKKNIVEIRKLYDEGILTQTKIAEKFNVSTSTISAIVNFKRYKNVS